MKKSTITKNREFMFTCVEDAKATLRRAIEIAKIYGYVTVADMCDLTGVTPICMENLVGWSLDAIKKAEIREYYYNDGQGNVYSYVLYLPQYDIEQAFSELFKNSDKIKDRPVFINIM